MCPGGIACHLHITFVPGWQAILLALDIVRTQSWFGACRVWLYRGAWQVSALRKPTRSMLGSEARALY